MVLGIQERGAEGTQARGVRGLHDGGILGLWSNGFCCFDAAWWLPKMYHIDGNIELCYD